MHLWFVGGARRQTSVKVTARASRLEPMTHASLTRHRSEPKAGSEEPGVPSSLSGSQKLPIPVGGFGPCLVTELISVTTKRFPKYNHRKEPRFFIFSSSLDRNGHGSAQFGFVVFALTRLILSVDAVDLAQDRCRARDVGRGGAGIPVYPCVGPTYPIEVQFERLIILGKGQVFIKFLDKRVTVHYQTI